MESLVKALPELAKLDKPWLVVFVLVVVALYLCKQALDWFRERDERSLGTLSQVLQSDFSDEATKEALTEEYNSLAFKQSAGYHAPKKLRREIHEFVQANPEFDYRYFRGVTQFIPRERGALQVKITKFDYASFLLSAALVILTTLAVVLTFVLLSFSAFGIAFNVAQLVSLVALECVFVFALATSLNDCLNFVRAKRLSNVLERKRQEHDG